MRTAAKMNQCPEIGIDDDQDALFAQGPRKQSCVPRIRPELTRFHDVVPRRPEPCGQPSTGAAVDQEPHVGAIRTASSRSLAITAWA